MILAKKILRSRAALLVFAGLFCATLLHGEDKGFRLNIPKHTKPTPVQSYNRDGVRAIEKHDYNRAKRLFYKAYLLDPNDPFTLNNLGYVAELEGDVDRAQRFYELAQEQNSQATVDRASNEDAKGKTVAAVAGHAETGGLQLNVMNVEAIGLLNKDRVAEADALLGKALKLDPKNPFTLNNLGYAMEGQGDLDAALRYYNQASMTHSKEPVVVALDSHWRGRPISDIAFRNQEAVRKRLATQQSNQDRAARLNLEGVSAINHNDPKKAYDYFRQAYHLDPENAFSLNNMGYVAEAQGDEETASDFYARARRGDQAGTPVRFASHHEMVGEAVTDVADSNTQGADASLRAEAEARRRQHAPVVLRRRDNTPVTGPAPESPSTAPQTQNPQVPRPPVDNAPVENSVPRPPH